MNSICNVRHVEHSSLSQREKWRERLWFGIISLLLLMLISSATLNVSLYQRVNDPKLFRSDGEMINGGKRFIDYFYSLNAATVDRDHFRAIKMMYHANDRKDRLDYLIKNDIVRKTQASRLDSEIDWSQSEYEIKKRYANGSIDIEYKTYLVRNNRDAGALHIVLQLIPVEKNDDNTDGVGVISWNDIAKNPFGAENEI